MSPSSSYDVEEVSTQLQYNVNGVGPEEFHEISGIVRRS